jgi:hypothetical protein
MHIRAYYVRECPIFGLNGSEQCWLFLAAISYGPKHMLATWRWYVDEVQTWRYGKFRPSLKEIDRMLSEEYRKKLADPKFRKWVNHFPPAKESPWESISRNP